MKTSAPVKNKAIQKTQSPQTNATEYYEGKAKQVNSYHSRKQKRKNDPQKWMEKNKDFLRAEYCRRSFAYFIKYFWDTVDNEELKWNWHLDVFVNELESIAKQVAEERPKEYDTIINVPPGSTKTQVFNVMFPVWCWSNWDWMKFVVSSYSSPLSLEKAELSREIVRSEKFARLFPAQAEMEMSFHFTLLGPTVQPKERIEKPLSISTLREVRTMT